MHAQLSEPTSIQNTRKRLKLAIGIVLALAAVALPFLFVQPPSTKLVTEPRTYTLAIANTDAGRERGLGGRASMPEDRGMIFVFDEAGSECFWMKDMQFSLDMIWLDSSKTITQIDAGVAPGTYPKQFCGDKTTRYVIELNAGEAKRAGLHVGKTLSL